jgi:putative transposase
MRALFEVLGMTKQAHWGWRSRAARELEDETLVLRAVRHLRGLHPQLGGRKLYALLQPECMGRDRFMGLLAENDLLVARRRSSRRTTWSVKSWRYANLLDGAVLTGPDQAWVTDITYFFIGLDCYYIVMIMDLYTRKVLGFNVEIHMRTESCLAALQMAFAARGRPKYGFNLIHHSDRGTQYVSDAYTNALEDREVRISMCLVVYENAQMERLNGTIKNEYLGPMGPKYLKELKQMLAKSVGRYNDMRPHNSLGGLTPTEYEQSLLTIPEPERKEMRIYVDPKTKERNQLRNQLTIFDK